MLAGRTIWIADAHRGHGRRFIVHADEKLSAFLELERAVCIHLLSENLEKQKKLGVFYHFLKFARVLVRFNHVARFVVTRITASCKRLYNLA